MQVFLLSLSCKILFFKKYRPLESNNIIFILPNDRSYFFLLSCLIIKASTFYSSKLIKKRIYWKKNFPKQLPRWCFIQKVFVKFSQNSLENNCAEVLNCRHETCNITKKETPTQVFFYKFWEIFKITIFIENLRWLLLKHFVYMSLLWSTNSFQKTK